MEIEIKKGIVYLNGQEMGKFRSLVLRIYHASAGETEKKED